MLDLLRNNTTYRRFLYGRIVTNTGDSLYLIAGSWLVYELTGSVAHTGLAAFLYLLPSALQFLTGPFADRLSLKRIFVTTQVFQGVVILLIPIADMFGVLSYPLLLVIIPILAMTNQFIYPAQTTLLHRIVAKDNLVRANTLFSFSYRSIDVITRSLSGVIIAAVGAISLFVLNSITFFMAAYIFRLVNYPSIDGDIDREDDQDQTLQELTVEYARDIRSGAGYLRQTLFRYIIAGSMVTNAAIGTSLALLPKFADTLGGAAMYGFLLTALSAGVLIGALVATVIEDLPFGHITIAGFLPGGLAWIGAINVQSNVLTVFLFGLAWIPIGAFGVYSHTLKQVGVPDDLVGRVSATYNSATVVTQPLGALFGGVLGELFGVERVLTVAGFSFLVVFSLFLLHTELRRLPPAKETGPEQMRI